MPKHNNINEKNKINYKNAKLNSMNDTYNKKISCETSHLKCLNFTNITKNTNSNNNTIMNINNAINNNNEEISKKSFSTFILDNNNIKDNIMSYKKKKININQNKNNKNSKEENLINSPLKYIHNVIININNEININNNNHFNNIMTFNKNNSKRIKANKNAQKIMKENKYN